MKKTLLSMLAVAAMFGMAANAFAEDIPGAKDAKAGDIGRHETASGVNEWLNPENGVYGLHTFAADANDWDSQFFIVFSDKVVSAGTPISIKFEYRKDGDGAVKFNAQGHGDPHAYVNNDGWATLEATNDWQPAEYEIEASGEIRTFAVNASIARENGTLYMRNIVIEVNYEEAVATKETDADAAELEAAPEIKEPEPMTETDFKAYFAAVDTSAAGQAASYFVANNNGQRYVPQTVKFDGSDVFAIAVDTSCGAAWNVQFFAYWTLEQVSTSTVSPTEAILSFDYWVDYAAAGGGNISHNDYISGAGNQGAKWGAIALGKDAEGKAVQYKDNKPAWVNIADTVKDSRWFWELHLGAAKPKFSYTVFMKNVEVKVDGKVVASIKDSKAADITVKELGGGVAVAEAAAINAYVAGNVLYTSEASDVVIYNINGVAVKAAKNVTTLNVADLKSGLYLAKVGNRVVKFVK
jgi:hypothetical protein